MQRCPIVREFSALLTVSPQVSSELVGGLAEQRDHRLVQGVHVLHQPAVCLVVHLGQKNTQSEGHKQHPTLQNAFLQQN